MYDQGVASQGYFGPTVVAKKLVSELLSASSEGTPIFVDINMKNVDIIKDIEVLDAGCGTGLVGQELAKLYGQDSLPLTLHGCDISEDMMMLASNRGYSDLKWCDLTKPLDMYAHVRGTYDAVTIAGTFTDGHVGPSPAIEELLALLKPGGLLLATVRQSFFEEMGFGKVLEEVTSEGECSIVEMSEFQYLAGVVAKLMVIRKDVGA